MKNAFTDKFLTILILNFSWILAINIYTTLSNHIKHIIKFFLDVICLLIQNNPCRTKLIVINSNTTQPTIFCRYHLGGVIESVRYKILRLCSSKFVSLILFFLQLNLMANINLMGIWQIRWRLFFFVLQCCDASIQSSLEGWSTMSSKELQYH